MAPEPITDIHIPNQGTIRGSIHPTKRIVRFLNVPYGTVNERWRPASKPEPWTGIRDATKQGPVSPQPRGPYRFSRAINTYSGFDMDDETIDFDERHCLNVNIYVHEDTLAAVHENPGGEGVPVMSYIHGGGNRDGANAMDIYDGTNIVAESVKIGRPVIVVVPNHRLHFLGFFSCPELVEDVRSDERLETEYEQSVGNWGLMDQKLALEWVKTHISQFGGAPNQVTAFGESAGSVGINYHLMIPQHHGLFQRAIMQSCSMNSVAAYRPELEGKVYFDYLVDYFKLPKISRREQLALLKKIPSKEFGLAAESPKLNMFTAWEDGVLLHEDARKWVHKTEFYDRGVKALMIGDTKEEGSLFIETLGAPTLARWGRVKQRFCPPTEEGRKAWKEVYGEVRTDEEARNASSRVTADFVSGYPVFSTLRAASKREDLCKGFDLFQFYFDRSIRAVDEQGRNLGAHHGVDLAFLFAPDLALEKVFTEEEVRLSEQVRKLWIQFAYGETNEKQRKEDTLEVLRARIQRPVDDYEYHQSRVDGEAIVITDKATMERDQVSRAGRKVFEFWEQSEKWVSNEREQMKDGEEEGWKYGIVTFTRPSQQEWS